MPLSRVDETVDVDVLVIGMGPAGASAAERAARSGLKVLAVERKSRVGEPIQCAEFIPQPLVGLARTVGAVRQPISAMVTTLPSGTTHASEFRGAVIDRALFDSGLVTRAVHSGAELWTRTRLQALDADGSRARLYRRGNVCEVRYRTLVAADGPRSRVAQTLGLPALETVRARQTVVRLRRPDDRTRIWLSDTFAGGYGWLFPRGAVANLGFGADRRFVRRPAKTLGHLHRSLVSAGLVERSPGVLTSGLIPCGGLRETLCVGNVLFAGDAAGTAHPVSGAGIQAAVVSGALAGEATADLLLGRCPDALEAYAVELREWFGGAFERALARRAELTRLWSAGRPLHDRAARRGWIAFDDYYAAL